MFDAAETLALVAKSREPFLFCVGGSSISERRNPMSDTDLFAIGDAPESHRARALSRLFERADLEWRTMQWLDAIGDALSAFRPTLAAGPSPFSWADLRFLARVLLGAPIFEQGGVLERIRALETPIRTALAAYLSTYYVNTYEDVLGLHRAGRDIDALALAGELAQRAALLGLLQGRLVEPASKWALTIARDGPATELQAPARRMLGHLAAFDRDHPDVWVRTLLWRANGLVAAGVLAADHPEQSHQSEDAAVSEGICVMGVPAYIALLDLDRSSVLVCNRAYLRRYLP